MSKVEKRQNKIALIILYYDFYLIFIRYQLKLLHDIYLLGFIYYSAVKGRSLYYN